MESLSKCTIPSVVIHNKHVLKAELNYCCDLFSFQFYYYFAIVEDFVLRFVWSLTVSVGEGLLLHSELLRSLLALLEIFRYNMINTFFYCEQSYLVELLYTNVDQKLVNSLHGLLTCEIGGLDCVVLLQQSIEQVSIVYTCNTYFAMHWSV